MSGASPRRWLRHQADPRSPLQVGSSCRTLDSAKALVEGVKGATPIALDVSDDKALDAETAKVDLVISLIPYTHHATVIKSAIREKKHVVTTSYVSPAMMELDQQCKDAGITVMNEIDAVKTIEEVHKQGGKLLSFESFCGAAPEASNNPLGYKFSWSPRGVLLALRNTGKWWEDGKVREIDGRELMTIASLLLLTPTATLLLTRSATTSLRGSMRYVGFPELVKTLVDMGFLDESESDTWKTSISWREATKTLLGASASDDETLASAIDGKATFKNAEQRKTILAGLRWIGVLSDEKTTPRNNPLDTLCASLEQKMQYEEGERDMVLLQHKFGIELADGTKQVRTSTLCEYGSTEPGGYMAMQVLEGTLAEKGILAPMSSKINDPLIKELHEVRRQGCYPLSCQCRADIIFPGLWYLDEGRDRSLDGRERSTRKCVSLKSHSWNIKNRQKVSTPSRRSDPFMACEDSFPGVTLLE
ncbi:saccharopine dehydrogenase NADP binding domain-containing protein [Sarocladium implicatum]|nr:saccharopine dehydrogenase NADP binding domain-containing protein [Sarocladium implicatum]